MKNDVINYLEGIYQLQHSQIANLYDIVEEHYKSYTEFEILEKCNTVIENSLGKATCLVNEFWDEFERSIKREKGKKIPEQIVLDTLEGMRGIGGISTNEEFYTEFNFRLRVALGLHKKEDEIIEAEIQLWSDTIQAVEKCIIAYIKFKGEKPKPPKPRTVVSYTAKSLRLKLKLSKEYLFNIFNKKKS